MGSLVEQGTDPIEPRWSGEGQKLIDWWVYADAEDRALFHRWVDESVALRIIADRLTAAGFPMCKQTVASGIRRLRSSEWGS